MGAMRLPNIHFMKRVFDLLKTLDMGKDKDNMLIEYKCVPLGNISSFMFANLIRCRYHCDYTFQRYNNVLHNSADPVPLDIFQNSHANGGTVPDEYANIGMSKLIADVYAEYTDEFNQPNNFEKAWKKLTEQDALSTRGYMLSQQTVS